MKKIIILLFLFFAIQGYAQINEIISSLKSGNSKELSAYFNQNIELYILETDNVYSKSQAEQIINNFFIKNKPNEFKFIYKSADVKYQYAIGNLITDKDTFRVYFLIEKKFINILRIEK